MQNKNNLDNLWQKVLEKIQENLSKPSFETWFQETKIIAIQNNLLIIEVPNEFAKDWIETRYSKLIAEIVENITNKSLDIKFVMP